MSSIKVPIKALRDQLFSDLKTQVYAVLDGASIPNLLSELEASKARNQCLLRGELDPALAKAAPYLVHLQADSALTEWLLKGWGNHWGIFVITQADFIDLRKHFRAILMVYDPDGKPLYFRYYDPRVLRVYLTTCNAQETQQVFGPVLAYITEGETTKTLLRFLPGEEQPVCSEIALVSGSDDEV
ncbi:MAG: DUF4123 domain-containing protein [Gammaproteobacteria bacterium]|nr:DUF4123 domain-containing protein [Gammaproteobacteria bacterium]